jgi:deoxycytidine triphosphate deaminase
MFLSSREIERLVREKEIEIDPFEPANLKGISYTFTLGTHMKRLKHKTHLDSREAPEFTEYEIDHEGYELLPGAFAVFYTKEKVKLNNKYVCFLSTRAGIAQMGLNVTQGSFLAEPDTDNLFALEITNRSKMPVFLYPGTKIVKGAFSKVSE